MSPRRILWALNRRTLMPHEVRILRDLGFVVFMPRVLPRGTDDRSTAVETTSHGVGLQIPPKTLCCTGIEPLLCAALDAGADGYHRGRAWRTLNRDIA